MYYSSSAVGCSVLLVPLVLPPLFKNNAFEGVAVQDIESGDQKVFTLPGRECVVITDRSHVIGRWRGRAGHGC